MSDLMFDPSTGMVKESELSQGLIKDIESGKKTINVNDIVSMNQEMIVVKSNAEEEVKNNLRKKE